MGILDMAMNICEKFQCTSCGKIFRMNGLGMPATICKCGPMAVARKFEDHKDPLPRMRRPKHKLFTCEDTGDQMLVV